MADFVCDDVVESRHAVTVPQPVAKKGLVNPVNPSHRVVALPVLDRSTIRSTAPLSFIRILALVGLPCPSVAMLSVRPDGATERRGADVEVVAVAPSRVVEILNHPPPIRQREINDGACRCGVGSVESAEIVRAAICPPALTA